MTTTFGWVDGQFSSGCGDPREPVRDLLTALNLLEDEQAGAATTTHTGAGRAFGSTTPFTAQAITAGATASSKISAWVVGVVGSGTAALAAAQAWWGSQPDSLQLVLAASSGLVLVVTVLAISLIVRADLAARATATAAQYEARASTAAALLRNFGRGGPVATDYWARTKDGRVLPVEGLRFEYGQIKLEVRDRLGSDVIALTSGELHDLRHAGNAPNGAATLR